MTMTKDVHEFCERYVDKREAFKQGHYHGFQDAMKMTRNNRIEKAARHAMAGLLANSGLSLTDDVMWERAYKAAMKVVDEMDKIYKKFQLEKFEERK